MPLCKEGKNTTYLVGPKVLTNKDQQGSLGRILFSGHFHKFGRGGDGGIVVHVEKGGLQEGGLPRVWHRLTLFVFHERYECRTILSLGQP